MYQNINVSAFVFSANVIAKYKISPLFHTVNQDFYLRKLVLNREKYPQNRSNSILILFLLPKSRAIFTIICKWRFVLEINLLIFQNKKLHLFGSRQEWQCHLNV